MSSHPDFTAHYAILIWPCIGAGIRQPAEYQRFRDLLPSRRIS